MIESINTPDERMERTSSLEAAIRTYTASCHADKRLGVEKDGIAAVDLVIRHDGREWISGDRLKLDSFRSDPVVAAAVTDIRKATGAAMNGTEQNRNPSHERHTGRNQSPSQGGT